jgi:hypothetical protein
MAVMRIGLVHAPAANPMATPCNCVASLQTIAGCSNIGHQVTVQGESHHRLIEIGFVASAQAELALWSARHNSCPS